MLRLLDVWGVEFMADSIRGITVKCLDSPVYTVSFRDMHGYRGTQKNQEEREI